MHRTTSEPRPPAPTTRGARRSPLRSLAAAGAALALVLAACDDDGSDLDADADVDVTVADGDAAGTAPSTTSEATTDTATSGTVPGGSTATAGAGTTATGDTTETTTAPTGTDAVPSGPLCDVGEAPGAAVAATGDQSLTEAIGDIDSLSTFATALEQSDAATARLEGRRPVTVFAPTDEAFADVDVDALLADRDRLDAVLLQHVVAGRYTSEQFAATPSLQTQAGGQLTFAAEGETVTVNGDVEVGCADLVAANGVIHIVDGVFDEPSQEATTPTTAGG